MSEKPESLRLADILQAQADRDYAFIDDFRYSAAAELRRLHAENERLREALTYDWDQLEACRESLREHMVEIKRLRAHGFSAECNVLLGRADAAWVMLQMLRDALRRMDPAWCDLHGEAQLDDEEFDTLLGMLEDLLEDGP